MDFNITQVDLPGVMGAVKRNRLLDLSMQAQEDATKRRNALADHLPSAMKREPQALEQVAAADPEKYMQLQQHFTTMDAAERDKAIRQAPIVARALRGVADPRQYEAVRRNMASVGIEIPEWGGPETVQGLLSVAQALQEPMSPKDRYMTAGGTVLDVSGEQPVPVYRAPKDAPAEPETIRMMRAAGIDPNSPEGRQILRGRLNGELRPSEREAKIADIMGTYGVDRMTAGGIVNGVVRVEVDPMTRAPFLVNLIDGTSRPLSASAPQTGGGAQQPGPAGAPRPVAPSRQAGAGRVPAPPQEGAGGLQLPAPGAAADPTLWNMADDVTGLVPTLQEMAQGVTGQVGINAARPELLENRQTFRTAKNDLVRALSINPRFPVGEIERISEEVNIEPGVFTDPVTLRARMTSVSDYLTRRLENEEVAARDASLPVETRQNAATAAKDIRNFLQQLGVPADQAERRGIPGAPAVGAVEDGYRYMGGDPASPSSWQEVR